MSGSDLSNRSSNRSVNLKEHLNVHQGLTVKSPFGREDDDQYQNASKLEKREQTPSKNLTKSTFMLPSLVQVKSKQFVIQRQGLSKGKKNIRDDSKERKFTPQMPMISPQSSGKDKDLQLKGFRSKVGRNKDDDFNEDAFIQEIKQRSFTPELKRQNHGKTGLARYIVAANTYRNQSTEVKPEREIRKQAGKKLKKLPKKNDQQLMILANKSPEKRKSKIFLDEKSEEQYKQEQHLQNKSKTIKDQVNQISEQPSQIQQNSIYQVQQNHGDDIKITPSFRQNYQENLSQYENYENQYEIGQKTGSRKNSNQPQNSYYQLESQINSSSNLCGCQQVSTMKFQEPSQNINETPNFGANLNVNATSEFKGNMNIQDFGTNTAAQQFDKRGDIVKVQAICLIEDQVDVSVQGQNSRHEKRKLQTQDFMQKRQTKNIVQLNQIEMTKLHFKDSQQQKQTGKGNIPRETLTPESLIIERQQSRHMSDQREVDKKLPHHPNKIGECQFQREVTQQHKKNINGQSMSESQHPMRNNDDHIRDIERSSKLNPTNKSKSNPSSENDSNRSFLSSELEEKIKYLTKFLKEQKQMKITFDNISCLSSIWPEFSLSKYYGCELMKAKKISVFPTTTFVITSKPDEFDINSDYCLGIIESNWFGDVLNVYRIKKEEQTVKRALLATIVYKTKIIAMGKPRQFQVYVRQRSYRYLSFDEVQQKPLHILYKQNKDQQISMYQNKKPRWIKGSHAYMLNLGNKAKQPAIQNFVLEKAKKDRSSRVLNQTQVQSRDQLQKKEQQMQELNKSSELMLLSKQSKHKYYMKIFSSFSPFLAFAIALSNFTKRIIGQ